MVAVALSSLTSLITGITPYLVKGVVWAVGFKEELKKLSSTLDVIQNVLQRTYDEEFDREMTRQQLKAAVYDAEDLLDRLATALRRNQVARFIHESRIHLDIEELNRRFDHIGKYANSFLPTRQDHQSSAAAQSRSRPMPRTFLPTSLVDISTVVGRNADRDKIVKMLLDSNYDKQPAAGSKKVSINTQAGDCIPVIRVVGMAGMGKTTVAQLVYNDPRIEQHFPEMNRIWVCATVNFDLCRILREIMTKPDPSTRTNRTAVVDSSTTEDQLHRDFQKFISGRRFFLVLDDVWSDSHEEWSRLLFLLKGGAKESRVLVTSKEAGTGLCRVRYMHNIIYQLDPLSPDDCWSLFRCTAFGQVGEEEEGNSSRPCPSSCPCPCPPPCPCPRPSPCPPELEEYATIIVGKCQNLPLAVQAMAALLGRLLDPADWRRISQLDLWQAEKTVSTSQRPNILPALKVSYNHLPFYLRPLFDYCSIFPRGYLFHKDHLVQLWIAEGLIHFQRHERAEEIARQHFDELLMRFFFQTSNAYRERYVMHDLFHDLAKSIADPYFCLVPAKNHNTSSTSSWHYYFTEQTRHVSLVCEDVQQPLLEMTSGESGKVRTLLFPSDNFKVFGSLFLNDRLGGMQYIRVLDLSSSSTILKLPDSIQNLKLLRYLNLSKTGIKRLPDCVCELYNLQTLLLFGCDSLSELPKDFAKLINLRHLELDKSFWCEIKRLPPRIGSLTSLHNLHAFPIGLEEGCRIDELKGMAYLTGTLHILKLENAVENTAAHAKLNEKENLGKLVLEWSSSTSTAELVEAEQALKVLEELQPHPDIKKLKIFHFKGTALPRWMSNGKLLPNLVAVSLKNHTTCNVVSLGELPSLKKLEIIGMQALEELHEQSSGGGGGAAAAAGGNTYASLNLLKISDCPNLTKLPSHFPKLEDVEIGYCPKLEALPHENFKPKRLEIRGCKLLRGLLPAPEGSKQIQHLGLHECEDETLVDGIPETCSLKSLVVSKIAKATHFARWPYRHLPGLETLHILDCNDLVSLSSRSSPQELSPTFQNMTSLKYLYIQRCSQLVALPDKGLPTTLKSLTIGPCRNLESLGPDDVFKNLTSLQDLYIEDCPKLQSLPNGGVSTSLNHLVIKGCPTLIAGCRENGGGPDWQKINDIPDREIDFATNDLDTTSWSINVQ